jgi:hypothetical protein
MGSMTSAVAKALLVRDLEAFIRQMEAYPDPAAIWTPVPGL